MKHNGKDVLFLVHKEYLNYRYHEPAFRVAAKLVSSKIQDSYLAENGETVLWIEKKYNDRLPDDFIILIESEYNEHEHRIMTHYKLANVLDDRLPQHPFIYSEDVMNGHTGNPARDRLIKKLLEAGEDDG